MIKTIRNDTPISLGEIRVEQESDERFVAVKYPKTKKDLYDQSKWEVIAEMTRAEVIDHHAYSKKDDDDIQEHLDKVIHKNLPGRRNITVTEDVRNMF